jgi:hypothetical protein
MDLGNANFQLSYDTVLFDVLKIRKRFNALPLKVGHDSCIRTFTCNASPMLRHA